MNSQYFVVTIDGLAATGKSTLAPLIAQELGWFHLNSGWMYRHVALVMEKLKLLDSFSLEPIQNLCFTFEHHTLIETQYTFPQKNYSLPTTVENTLLIAQQPHVRDFINHFLRQLSLSYSLVAEGRDMATIVFPQALKKFFLTASLKIRTQRRLEQLQNPNLCFESVYNQLRHRDHQDTTRAIAPLIVTDDMEVVDTSHTALELNLQHILRSIYSCLNFL